MPKTHPLIIKRIGTSLLDHVPGAPTVFPVNKLAKVDCALDNVLMACFHRVVWVSTIQFGTVRD